MTQPGILSQPLTVQPLRRISPSRYTALGECILREIWTVNRQTPLLPPSPVAKLGTVIHSLLEQAGKGQIGQNDENIETTWNELINQVEASMKACWLERFLVPLRDTVQDYEVRKIRASQKAGEITQSIAYSHPGVRTSFEQFELWVQSNDGSIGGYIDQVARTTSGITLRDYKSGYVMHKNELTGDLGVKEAYQVQLKLYAALYAATCGQFPNRLEIVPLQGSSIAIPFTESECIELLHRATQALSVINNKVNEVLVTYIGSREELLAAPSPSTCRFCQFRPGCSAYQKAPKADSLNLWSKDVVGTVESIQILGNGRLSIRILVGDRPYQYAKIRGLSPDESRHPALQNLQNGDIIGIYNLQGSLETGAFAEAVLTAIYKYL